MAVVIPDATLHATHLTATEMKQELAIVGHTRRTLDCAPAGCQSNTGHGTAAGVQSG